MSSHQIQFPYDLSIPEGLSHFESHRVSSKP